MTFSLDNGSVPGPRYWTIAEQRSLRKHRGYLWRNFYVLDIVMAARGYKLSKTHFWPFVVHNLEG